MKHLFLSLILLSLAGCYSLGDYALFPDAGYRGGYGYPYPPPLNYGYGAYPLPAYGYYPGPIFYGPSYGGYEDFGSEHRPALSQDQRALNYLYDHRSAIKNLSPQQQREVMREANKLVGQNSTHPHHPHHRKD